MRIILMTVLICTGCANIVSASELTQYDFRNMSNETTPGFTIHGATRTPEGLLFDGVDDYVDCGKVELDGSMTLEAWIKPQMLPDGEGWLMGRGPGSFLVSYSGSNYPGRVYFHIGQDKKMVRAKAVAQLWHHVAAVYDGKLLRIYIDGILQGGVRTWKHTGKDGDDRFLIGGGGQGFSNFHGLISQVSLYNRALSPQEAWEHFQAGAAEHRNNPRPRKPFEGPGVKPLNNMVAELLNKSAEGDHTFYNPRDGWVFVACDAATIELDGKAIASGEAMQRLNKGEHRLSIKAAKPVRVVVRAIPQLFYAAYPTSPRISEYGPYDWSFVSKHVLPHVNTIVGMPVESETEHVKQWQADGREWIAEHSAGWYDYAKKKSSETVDDFYNTIMAKPGMTHPLTDGVLLDTHDVANNPRYRPYAKAIKRLGSESNKHIYLYCDTLVGGKTSELFAKAAFDANCTFVQTQYLHELPTQQMAASFIRSNLADAMTAWDNRFPDVLPKMAFALGGLTSPGERMDIEPGANFYKFMDMQCRALATDPAFAGLGGVMWYKSHYMNEDYVRFGAKLFRHYFIEGKTTALIDVPYLLEHLTNPDFAEGLKGWKSSGIVTGEYLDRFGFAQGRWLETGSGDRYALMMADSSISQKIQKLKSGQLYSIELISCERQGLLVGKTKNEKHPVAITCGGAEWIEEKCFQKAYKNFGYYHLGPYDDQEPKTPIFMNYHRRIFRATESTADLTITADDLPEQSSGMMINFVQVQPYLQ